MDKVMIVVFHDEKQAYEGSRAFRDLHKEGSITLYADAVIAKDLTGKVLVRRSPDPPPAGTFFGLLIGSLIGALGGPAGMAVGAGAGVRTGGAFDLTRAGIGHDFIDEVSAYLIPGKAAIVTELDEDWQTPVDTRMEALGGKVFRRNRIEVEDAYYEKEIFAYRAEIAALETERMKASAERRAKLDAKIKEANRRLKAREDELEARILSLKREGEAKIESLEQQLKTAQAEGKVRLEKLLAAVRVEYRERSVKLREAWELMKVALTP